MIYKERSLRDADRPHLRLRSPSQEHKSSAVRLQRGDAQVCICEILTILTLRNINVEEN